MCIAIFCMQAIKYFSYPVNTVQTTKESKGLPFPAVTVCNYNWIRKSAFQDFPEMIDLLEKLAIDEEVDWNDPGMQLAGKTNVTALYTRGAHKFDEMILRCTWASEEVNCADVFTVTFVDTSLCYTFNSEEMIKKRGKSLISTRAGHMHGLGLLIDVQQEEYLIRWSEGAGIKMLVYSPYSIKSIESEGFPVAPGMETHVKVEERRIKRLPAPYDSNNCIEDANEAKLKYFPLYTLENCNYECEMDFYLRKCNCTNLETKDHFHTRLCNLKDLAVCLFPAFVEYVSSPTIEGACGCRVLCDEVQYKTKVYHAKFPGQFAMDDLSNQFGVTPEYIRENFLHLNVHFSQITYEMIEEEPGYTIIQALSELGGVMGICVGASVLTIFETIDFFWVTGIGFVKRRRAAANRTTGSQTKVLPAGE